MRYIFTKILMFATIICNVAFARIVMVPDEYTTIQEGVYSCNDGDTVLVEPGIYSENISFDGRNIVVASNYLISGDFEYIESTIIDGSQAGSVVIFQGGQDSLAVLIGFTIRNGFSNYGGGIRCQNSSPSIRKNIIIDNQGPSDYYGGGIYCSNSTAIIEENTIANNSACWGGGIYSIDSDLRILRNRILYNSAFE